MIFKCKMCGGSLEIKEGQSVCTCDFCGSTQTIPNADSEKKLTLFNRANALRQKNEFDKAIVAYQSILSEFPNDGEAHWGMCLCKFGIEYVDDPSTGEKVPTCHRTLFDSIFDDVDYKEAIKNADVVAKDVYASEAREIDRLQKHIIKISQKEEPYDIFICYKETGADGQRTQDSVLAQDIYDKLTEKGYKVFFARITLENRLGLEYEPIIFAALRSAKVMLAIGTKDEYFNAVWVKNEWSRFLSFMRDDKDKYLIPCYKDMDAYDMPEEFLPLQSQDMSKIGYVQDLARGIDKIFGKQDGNTKAIKRKMTLDEIIFKLKECLLNYDFKKAEWLIDEGMTIDSSSSTLYLYKCVVNKKLKSIDDLYKLSVPINEDQFIKRAIEYGNTSEKKIINDIFESIKNNINEEKYSKALKLLNNGDYYGSKQFFIELSDYKDSKEKIFECDEKIKEKIYYDAVECFKTGNFDNATKLFGQIEDFRDAKEYTKNIPFERTVTKVKKDILYAISSLNDSKFNSCIQQLEEIKDYKGVFELINSYKKQFENKKQAIQKQKKRKKSLFISLSSALCALTAFFVILGTVIVPSSKYNDAMSLIASKNFDDAETILNGLNFADSKNQLKIISAYRNFDNGDYVQGITDIAKIGGKITIFYDADGGVSSQSREAITSYPVSISATATKQGYEFSTWKLSDYYIDNKKNNYSAEVKLLSVYHKNTYTLTYDLDGGSWNGKTGPASYDVESEVVIPNPIKSGYTFSGWTGTSTTTETVNLSFPIGTIGDKTFKANWTPNKYSIVYNWNDNLGTMTNDEFVFDSAYALTEPNRIGYTFAGWEYNGNVVTQTGIWNIPNNVTLNAKWNAIKYNITYNLDGGENSPSNPSTYGYDSSNIVLADPTRAGYTFLGWTSEDYEKPTLGPSIPKHSLGDKTFTANWQKDTYSITYVLDGGSHENELNSYDVDTNYTFKNATKTGYSFKGWYTDYAFTNQITRLYKTTGNLTLYAKFTPNNYTITLNANEGNLDNPVTKYTVMFKFQSSDLEDITQELTNGQLLEIPSAPQRDGYTFVGWATNSSGTEFFNFNTPVEKDLTLYASWLSTSGAKASSPSTLYVTSTSTSTYSVFVDCVGSGKIILKASYPSNMRNTAIYVSVSLNGSTILSETGVYSTDGKNISFTAKYGDRLTFTYRLTNAVAQSDYFAPSLSISYSGITKVDYSSVQSTSVAVIPSTVSTRTVSVTYGSPYELPLPKRDGYVFDGWYLNDVKVENAGNEWNWSSGNCTLIAKWK